MVDNAKDRLGGAMDDAKGRGKDAMDDAKRRGQDEMDQVNAGGKNREEGSSGDMRDKFNDQKDRAMDKAKDFGNR